VEAGKPDRRLSLVNQSLDADAQQIVAAKSTDAFKQRGDLP
jgi:hypothetical protein